MTTGTIDRKTLLVLAGSVAAILILRFGVFADRAAPVVESVDSIPVAEQRLAHLREVAATLPARQRLLEGAQAELATREKTMLKADTMEQAQAQLLDLLQAVARAGYASGASTERGCHVAPACLPSGVLCLRREHIDAAWPLSHSRYFLARSAARASCDAHLWPPAVMAGQPRRQ